MTYQLLLTTLGQQKISAAANAGAMPVHISEFAVGQGIDVDFSQRLDEQVLVSKRYQGAVLNVASTAVAGQYEITCVVPHDQGGWTIREFGLIDSDGDLIWVGQLPEVQKPAADSTAAVDYRIKAVVQINNPKATLVVDANVVMASQDWVANNFVSNPRFAQFLALAYPYGYPYWSHSKANPKPLFDAMFGFETHWRRLEGVSMVAVKDDDAYIGQPMLTLGQRGMTELAVNQRPHTYPVYTGYLFERYDPSTVVETVWNVTADKTSVNEGDAIRFTVTANNLPDGQILDWIVKEGELNSASNDITTPEKVDSGTVILNNGQAVIDFTTTPDDNEVEPQKHVRLTVGAPADLSINVPISDAMFSETALHISQSTTDGIDLAEYYKSQKGQYPAPTDTVRFIVDGGIDIIAPDTTTPAISEGANWPVGATAIVENRGRILGHGGDGGATARYSQKRLGMDGGNEQLLYDLTTSARNGQDGGTAIVGNLNVDNYGLIAGGGGGGGGGGVYYAVSKTGYTINVDGVNKPIFIGGGGGAGGGAPYGTRYPNLHTLAEFLEHFNTSNVTIPSAADSNISHLQMNSSSMSYYKSFDAGGGSVTNLPTVSCNDKDVSFFTAPNWLSAAKDFYYWQSDSEGVMLQSQDAAIDTGGGYGYDLADSYRILTTTESVQTIPVSSVKQNHGGAGGALGESGDDGVIGNYYDFYGTVAPENIIKTLSPGVGGQAGYVKTGNVTITNYGSGATKGR